MNGAFRAILPGMGPQLDPLTGVFRRGPYEDWIEAAAPWLTPLPSDAAAIMLNLRAFRKVNDTRGHPFGDRMLQEIAHRIQLAVSPWPVWRLAGDEFTIAARVASVDKLRRLALTVRSEVEAPFEDMSVGVWMGAAMASPIRTTAQDLFRIAGHSLMAVCQNSWPELLIAGPEDTTDTWMERPPGSSTETVRTHLERYYGQYRATPEEPSPS
jgi:diguanylate cyclase (GGDEF)-like protein